VVAVGTVDVVNPVAKVVVEVEAVVVVEEPGMEKPVEGVVVVDPVTVVVADEVVAKLRVGWAVVVEPNVAIGAVVVPAVVAVLAPKLTVGVVVVVPFVVFAAVEPNENCGVVPPVAPVVA